MYARQYHPAEQIATKAEVVILMRAFPEHWSALKVKALINITNSQEIAKQCQELSWRKMRKQKLKVPQVRKLEIIGQCLAASKVRLA